MGKSVRRLGAMAVVAGLASSTWVAGLVPGGPAGASLADAPGANQLVSQTLAGKSADTTSDRSSISDDGRYVVFASEGVGLAAGQPVDDETDVFVRDLVTGTTTQVSVAVGGGAVDSASFHPQISGDGQWIVFRSDATNLVPGPVTDGTHAYRANRSTGAIELVDEVGSTLGTDVGSVSISDDGNLVAFDTAGLVAPTNRQHVLVRDMTTGTVTQVDVTPENLTPSATAAGHDPTISGNGRYVVFSSNDSRLANETLPNVGRPWLYRRDLQVGTTIHALATSAGVPTAVVLGDVAVSDDGRYVAVSSTATDLVAGDTNAMPDVVLRDLTTGTNSFVSVSSSEVLHDGSFEQTASNTKIAMSDDARYIVFGSKGNNLHPDDTGTDRDLFLRDTVAGTTTLQTRAADGSSPNSAVYEVDLDPEINGDGTWMTFSSTTSVLVGAPTFGLQVFARGPATAPGAPTAPAAKAWNGTVQVSWKVPAVAGGSPRTGYHVVLSPGGHVLDVAGGATTATFTGLANGTAYTATVQAVNATGPGAAATAGPVTPRLQAPFSTLQQLIRQQFADFVGRQPTATELSTWTSRLTSGADSPASLVDTLRAGPRWGQELDPIVRLYSAYFLRQPDAPGLEFWLERARGGSGLNHISSSFAQSPEFRSEYGQLDDGEFVALVYQNVLGRAPDSNGAAFWTGRLAAGASRGSVMVGFSESSEYRGRTAAAVAATSVLFGMLGRVPTAGEIAAWKAALAVPTPVTDLIAGVFASTEYAARVS